MLELLNNIHQNLAELIAIVLFSTVLFTFTWWRAIIEGK